MASQETLRIEVVCAAGDAQHVVSLELTAGATAGDAARQSGLLGKFLANDASGCKFGIFGRPVTANQVICNGDRVEIYQSLKVDPKEARRARARTQR